MRLLLDTSTFLWIVFDDARLSKAVREAFADPGNDVFLSAVSAWEIAVKHQIGKLPLPLPPDRFVPEVREAHGILPLPLDEAAVLGVSRLPDLHRDPFDRMLVCQAIAHGLAIATDDAAIRAYPARCVW
ncbi:MAG: type II toxin-antitoxin system VapC family toxin [Myxococcota bacterium]